MKYQILFSVWRNYLHEMSNPVIWDGQIFFYFSQITRSDISCQLSCFLDWRQFPLNEKILFSGKNNKKYFKMLSAENFTQYGKC